MWPWRCLYLEEEQLFVWQGLAAQALPLAELATYLRAEIGRNYRLVINQSREQIVPETLPTALRGSTALFMASRLQRLFPETPWRSVAPQARQGVKSDVCWLALSETPALRQVLAAFSESGAALLGIYSLVQLLPTDWHKGAHLLLSEHGPYVRCSLIAEGSVRASQLITATEDYRHEIRQFMARTRHKDLPLLLLGSTAWRQTLLLPEGLTPLPATAQSLRPLLTQRRRWPKQQFARPEQLTRARRRTRATLLGALGMCAALTATVWAQSWRPVAQPLPPPLPPAPQQAEAPAPEPVAPIAELPEKENPPAPRLEGRVSGARGVIQEWREGAAETAPDAALAVGDSPQQPLLPAGSLRIHREPTP